MPYIHPRLDFRIGPRFLIGPATGGIHHGQPTSGFYLKYFFSMILPGLVLLFLVESCLKCSGLVLLALVGSC